jgi:hypothetical protein
MVTFLARIFSACKHLAHTPQQWRRSENFVLYKQKGELTNINSFWSISLTQF